MTVSTRSRIVNLNDLSRQKNNKRISNRRKIRHQERCQQFRDEQLYYEASVLVDTLEGQIIKDIEEIQPEIPKKEIDNQYYFSFIPKSLFWW